MVIIWSGLGFVGLLVPAIFIISSLALSTNWWDANDSAKSMRALGIAFAIGCGLSAPALWFLGRWLNRPRKNEEANQHTLFFIPVQFWAFVWALACVGATIWSLTR